MTLKKISSFLGLAQRAGFIVSGSNSILQVVQNKDLAASGWLVVMAADALTPTGNDLKRKCIKAGLSVVRVPLTMFDLGLAIGKNHRGYVMIKDRGFAGRILALLEEMEVRPLDQD